MKRTVFWTMMGTIAAQGLIEGRGMGDTPRTVVAVLILLWSVVNVIAAVADVNETLREKSHD